jgi:hypothetical protein
MKHAAVDESKQQTAEYRKQLAARQVSHDKAEKANARGRIQSAELTDNNNNANDAKVAG